MSIKDQLDSARRVIDLEITKVTSNSSLIKNGGCASCHILFKLIETLSLNESDATDLLSEVLYQDRNGRKNTYEGQTHGSSVFNQK